MREAYHWEYGVILPDSSEDGEDIWRSAYGGYYDLYNYDEGVSLDPKRAASIALDFLNLGNSNVIHKDHANMTRYAIISKIPVIYDMPEENILNYVSPTYDIDDVVWAARQNPGETTPRRMFRDIPYTL